MAVEYTSEGLYLQTKTKKAERLAAIEAIIDQLMLVAADAASLSKGNVMEYWLDDGQTKIKTVYQGSQAIMNSIKAYEQLANMYRNQLNGRVMRNVDSKNLIGRR